MTSPDPTAQIDALGLEPAYSAREAAVLLGRSYSWLDQRVRGGQFTNPDGSVLQPLRTPGGYRRFRECGLFCMAICLKPASSSSKSLKGARGPLKRRAGGGPCLIRRVARRTGRRRKLTSAAWLISFFGCRGLVVAD